MDEYGSPRLLLIAMSALLAFAACSNTAALRRAELEELSSWLPGSYESSATTGGAAASPEPVLLIIVPVYAPSLGERVFYAQEMASADPRRVMSQRLLSFEVTRDGRILQTGYVFSDPMRWRDAHLNPELFKGLQPPDLRGPTGCAIVWTRTAVDFRATGEGAACAANGSAATILDAGARLGREELVLGAGRYDAGGRVVYGSEGEPPYRLRKRSQP
jgi:hypothetical protein